MADTAKVNLPPFKYLAPNGLDEALLWMNLHSEEPFHVLAGGTDLLVDLRRKVIPTLHKPPRSYAAADGNWVTKAPDDFRPPMTLLSINRIRDLHGIEEHPEGIHIGALTTLTDLESSALVKERLKGLWDGAYQLGSPLVRNRGTFGGNLCNARPAADTAIPTLALGGRLILKSVRGERVVTLGEFITAPGKTNRARDEILTGVLFPQRRNAHRQGSGYIKLANRKSLEISVVGAAGWVEFDETGTVSAARIALGAVAPTPLEVKEAGQALIGKKLDREAITEASRIAASIAKPITDHRGSREYRSRMVEVLVRRVLNQCESDAFGEGSR